MLKYQSCPPTGPCPISLQPSLTLDCQNRSGWLGFLCVNVTFFIYTSGVRAGKALMSVVFSYIDYFMSIDLACQLCNES